jgi:hypothetical protein
MPMGRTESTNTFVNNARIHGGYASNSLQRLLRPTLALIYSATMLPTTKFVYVMFLLGTCPASHKVNRGFEKSPRAGLD